MGATAVAIVTFVAVFGSIVGKAQVFQPTPAPLITAAGAEWRLRGEPVFSAGDFYDPTGPSVFFDGFVMVRSGSYEGVPLYVDTSRQPYSVILVPVGRNLMQPYARRSTDQRMDAGRSRAVSSGIDRDVERIVAEAVAGRVTSSAGEGTYGGALEPARPLGTVGPVTATPTSVRTDGVRPAAGPGALALESIPAPRSNGGIWIEFDAGRWYSSGAAVPHDDAKFVEIGCYRGFPVYRDPTGRSSEIYVATVADGPLAPYSRR
jgi:hypothetical protein